MSRPDPAASLRRSASVILAVSLLLYAPVPPRVPPALFAQEPAAAAAAAEPPPNPLDTLPPAAPLPVDPTVRIGELDNGLRYYIRPNDRPEDRVELRLVVDVGSVLETDEQRGFAHLVEHMAFNGTRGFSREELTDYLESIGMRFGPGVNASTSYDETIYRLRLPTNIDDALETGIRILADWAGHQRFDSAEVAQEIDVVMEEWRAARGAAERLRRQQYPVLYHGSRYAERAPIGEPEMLRTASSASLARFYRDWYQPELMAVIVVGDVGPDSVESLIRAQLGELAAPSSAPARRLYAVPPHAEPLFTIATDPEQAATAATVYHKRDVPALATVADYRRYLVRRVYDRMLGARLSERRQEPEPPFLSAPASTGRLTRTLGAYMLTARTEEGGLERGLRAILTEAERVRRHGFTETEVDRAKRGLMRGVEQAYAERDTRRSGSFVGGYIRHFLDDGAYTPLTPEQRYALYRRLLPRIALEEVDALADELMSDENRVVRVSAPETPDLPAPTEAELRAIFAAVGAAEIAPYEDRVASGPLVGDPPEPGAVVDASRMPEIDVVEWTLSNGATVVLRPTTFENDEVLFRGISPGGHSLAPDEAFVPAVTAVSVATSGGLGPFDRVTLGKALTGKAVSLGPRIGTYEEGFRGRASARDVETLFQMVHLAFRGARPDSAAFRALRTRLKASVANRQASPSAVFSDTVRATMTRYHPRARSRSPAFYDRMDLGRSVAFFEDRFADAGDFIFFFVGSFEPEELRPLVARYLATLPSNGREERWRDPGIRPPTGVVEKVVRAGTEPTSRTQIIFTGTLDYSRTESAALSMAAEILQRRLRELLREREGGTYGVSVSSSVNRRPEPRYSVSIGFGAAPPRLEELVATVFEEIERLTAEPPSGAEVRNEREARRRARETNREENGYWLGRLVYAYRHGEQPRRVLEGTDLDAVTPERIRDVARRYLRTDNYVRVSLYPEGES